MKRRSILILALILVLTLLPFGAQATESKSATIPFRVNPLYQGIYTPEAPSGPAPGAEVSGEYTYSYERDVLWAGEPMTVEEAAAALRKQMAARNEVCEILVWGVSSDYNATLDAVFAHLFDHTGNPKEGDYLAWQIGGYGGEVYDESRSEGYAFRYLLNMDYYTTAAQEAELDTAVKNLLNSLGVSGMSDYQKVKAVYDYMINNITYDEAHLNDETYTLQFTAYAALINKTAVCQGYANLLYRLLLEMGIDCRVIAGEVEGGAHGWNICKLGNVYYNLDATWDAGYDDYVYFLRNSEGFADHYRYLEYMTTQFHTDYPMSATDYEEGVEGEPEHIYVYGMCGEDAYWCIDRDKVLTIWGTGEIADFGDPTDENAEDPIIPWVYWLDGFDTVIVEDGITTIGRHTFSCTNNIKHITLPDSVTQIDQLALYACEGLVDIDLGNGLEIIEDAAFSFCISLASIEFPESLVSLGSAFENCSSLSGITIPNSTTVIKDYTFANCAGLVSANLDNGLLTEIGNYAFEGCESLSSIHIPDTVTHIGDYSFNRCYNLKEVTLGNGLQEIGLYAFNEACGQEDLALPEGLKVIGNGAFSNWDLLTEITIPDSVTYLSGFSFCDNLTTVHHNGLFTEIGGGAFRECPVLQSFTIPEGVTNIGDSAFSHCDSLTEMVIPAGASIADGTTFYYCENLQRVELHCDGIVGAYAFGDCNNLTELVITGDLTEFDTCAFDACTSLTSFTFTESVTKIQTSAFRSCFSLTEIEFLGDAPEITTDAFSSVTATAYYPAHNPTWTEDKLQNYGGSLTWVNGHTHEYSEDDPQFDSETKTHFWTCLTCGTVKTEACTLDVTVLEDATISSAGLRKCVCTVCGGSYEESFPLRLYGANRYETAFIVADTLKDELGVEKFENIVVANGKAFADALAGSYLAVQKNAPILLTNQNLLEDVAAYIEANLASGGTVYLLGGTSAVPAEMEELLEGLDVVRLAGENRYETNLLILEEAGIGDEEILICTGRGFADSLSASAVGKPILLVNKTLYEDQKEFLEATSGEFVIIGGESAVSAALAEELEDYGSIERLAGANRFETSVLVAERFFDAPASAVLAYSQNFPDGLCGGPLAAAMDAPLLLIATNRGPGVVEYANETGISCGAVLGGTGLIDDATAKNVFSMN